MKLLFVNMTPIYHNTSAVIRMCGFISGAHKNGHSCDLLTLRSEESDYLYDPTNESFVKEYIGTYYTFERSGAYGKISRSKGSRNIGGRLRTALTAIYRASNIYDMQVSNVRKVDSVDIDYRCYDRIISISDPKSSHKLAEEIMNHAEIDIEDKWIQCWGDPWFRDSGNRYMMVRRKVLREEEHFLSMAGRIVYTTPFTREEQEKLFPAYASKMVWVNQPVKETRASGNGQREKQLRKDTAGEGECTIGYFGNYTFRSRNMMPLYDTCVKGGHRLLIVGSSDFKLETTKTVCIIEAKTLSEVAKLEEQVDILICVCNRSGTQIPGKIYYSAGYQKPIILIVDGERSREMRTYFESFHRYIICENNEESIEKAIVQAKEDIRNNVEYKQDERYSDTYAAKVMLGED